jgi:hypothetical protein
MAEREGFEPSIRDKPYTPLAGERLQPLGHLSRKNTVINHHTMVISQIYMSFLTLDFQAIKDTLAGIQGKDQIKTF